ncbi:hypothetical protein HHI36_004911, partial [Cryptolaemus montrouzieri]
MYPGRCFGHNKNANPFPTNGLSGYNFRADSDTEIPTSSIQFRCPVNIPATNDEFSRRDEICLAKLQSTLKTKQNRD